MENKLEKPKTFIRGETFIHTVFRFISFKIVTHVLWDTNVTPNQVTVFRNVLLLIAYLFFLQMKLGDFIIGFFLFQFAELLDSVDGDLARYKKMQSKVGVWLEIFFDALLTPVWSLFGLMFAYIFYTIDGNSIYFILWGLVGLSANLESVYYRHFKGIQEGLSDAQHDHIYFGFIEESWKTKIRNFIVVSKIWENQWLLFSGMSYFLFHINTFLAVWIWLLLLNQIHWVRLAYKGYKDATRKDLG